MSLSLGIVGLPNVGKSTLFNALLKRQQALAANYPFATIEPNVGIVDLPDERLHRLAEIVKEEYGQRGDREVPERIMPAVVKFYDIAGLVKGASEGEGLGNQFLSHIREVDAIIQVVRDFSDPNVIRAGSTDPESDIEVINTELILADLQTINKRIEGFGHEIKKSRTPENLKKMELLELIRNDLDSGKTSTYENLSEDERSLIKDLNLLTFKPVIYVINVDEANMGIDSTHSSIIEGKDKVYLSAKIESELSVLSEEDYFSYIKELGIGESGLDKVIRKGFQILGLETYFTAGPKEVRAWTYRTGTKAPQAAGIIHTDFERGFISAEVVSFEELSEAGGWKRSKEKGLVRIEGKQYTMKDGDVVEFRFSV